MNTSDYASGTELTPAGVEMAEAIRRLYAIMTKHDLTGIVTIGAINHRYWGAALIYDKQMPFPSELCGARIEKVDL